jgi:hypothetical protein
MRIQTTTIARRTKMPVSYEMADESSVKLLEEMVCQHHAELKRYGVRIGLIMAFGPQNEDGEITKKPIMKSGVACAGMVRVVSLKDRLTKNLDAEILVDGDLWQEYDDLRKYAILDHELEHLRVQVNEDTGELQTDSLDRPKIKLIPDDLIWWGFAVIAARHGVNSQEVLCMRQLVDRNGEILNVRNVAPETKESA